MKNLLILGVLFVLPSFLGACSSATTAKEGSTATESAADLVPPENPNPDAIIVGNPETRDPEDVTLVPANTPTDSKNEPSASQKEAKEAEGENETTRKSGPSSPLLSKGGGKWVKYKVKSGDTLMKISFNTYADVFRWREILNANHAKISNPGAISAGTILEIREPENDIVIQRNGEKYLIKRGATLTKISHEVYGSTHFWRKLWENNKQLIHNPDLIFAGFFLYYLPKSGKEE